MYFLLAVYGFRAPHKKEFLECEKCVSFLSSLLRRHPYHLVDSCFHQSSRHLFLPCSLATLTIPLIIFVLQSIFSHSLFTRRTHLLLICIANQPYKTNSDKLACLTYDFPILQHSNIKRMKHFFLWDCFSHSYIYHMLFVKTHGLTDYNFPSS